MMATSVDTAPPTYPHGQGLTTLLAGAAWWGFWLLLAAPLAVGAVANGASWTWDGAFAVLSTFFRAGLEVAHGWGPLYRLALLLLALVAVGLGWRRIAATPAEARRRRRVLWGVRAALFGLSAWGFFHAVGQLALVTETVLNGALVDPPADDQAFKDTLLVELARAGATLDFDQVIVETLQREDIDRARVHAQAARLLGIPLRPETVKAYGEATDWGSSLRRGSWAVLEGAFTGESASLAGLAGALTLDLTPAGDLRDVAVQLGRMASEKPADEVVLGLSLFGMALTAATFVAPAQTVPMTTGKAVLKGALRFSKVSAGVAGDLRRLVGSLVDLPGLKQAVRRGEVTPDLATRYLRKQGLDELGQVSGEVYEIGRTAGPRAAVAVLQQADTLADLPLYKRVAKVFGKDSESVVGVLGKDTKRVFRVVRATWPVMARLGSYAALLLGCLGGLLVSLSGCLSTWLSKRLLRAAMRA
jgi:hypothetical protein